MSMSRFSVLGRAALPSQYHSATAPVLLSGQGAALLELHAGRGSAVHLFDLVGGRLQLQSTQQSSGEAAAIRIRNTVFALEEAALERLVDRGDQGSLGISRSEAFYSGQSGFAGDLAAVLSAPVAGRQILIGTGAGQQGLQSFERLGDGSLRPLQWLGDTSRIYARDVSAMASLEQGGTRYVFSAAQGESGISSFALGQGGQLTLRSSLGAAEGVGMAQPSALLALEVGGQAMLLAGAAGSGSITVMAVAADGRLSVLNHVSDTLETRFGGVQVLESFTHAGWTYVVAGGSDDGLTLFALLPGGRLMVLDSIADNSSLSLSNVNGLALSLVGGTLHVFATSESEPGVSHLRIDIAQSGAITTGSGSQLRGSARDDILIAGAAQQQLYGGDGADVFVLSGSRNSSATVLDFSPSEDRIDLENWAGLTSVDQLQISARTDGALLTYRGHELRLITQGSSSLSYEDFIRSDLLGLYRPPLASDTPVQIRGNDSAEQLVGADGNDSLRGMGGADTLFGQNGQDSLWGGTGADSLYGGSGQDRLYGEDDNDRLYGEDGHDQLFGGSGSDSLYGGLGEDLLEGGTGTDRAWGGTGNDSLSGGEGNDQLYGEAGNDRLHGDAGNDTLTGGDGNDHLNGGSGQDRMEGGAGADSLYGGSDNDRMYGGDGPDRIDGGDSNDSLYGGAGEDLLEGGTGADRIWGEAGNDSLSGASSTDQLFGGAGNDSLLGGTGDDTLYGGAGNDTIFGNTALDTIYGEAGDDYISSGDGVDFVDGGAGNDTIYGRSGWDSLYGGDDNDTLFGSEGDDLLAGGRGNDRIEAGSAWDRLFGNSGNDTLYGNFGSDWISGGSGEDALFGGTGDDTLKGGSGEDRLLGNQGVDVLEGGPGDDTLRGGTLADTFIFDRGCDRDLLLDYEVDRDTLQFSSDLVGANQTGQSVLNRFASFDPDGVRFDFGEGDTLFMRGLTDVTGLHGTIEIF